MTSATDNKMQCMEVWGGNHSTWSHFQIPGLEIWIYSQPVGDNPKGGDVYYLSSCASGRTTRMIVADVSGHGAEASKTAESLKLIMRKNVNFIDHSKLVSSMNKQFDEASSQSRFATALIGTFFLPTKRLSFCNAGHPQPLKFDQRNKHWSLLSVDRDARIRNNLPFGVDTDHKYESESYILNQGDLILCYTDALSESFDCSDKQLGTEGLLKVVESVRHHDDEFIPRLLSEVRQLNPKNLQQDDVTILMLKATETRVSMKDEILSPFRYFGRLFGIR